MDAKRAYVIDDDRYLRRLVRQILAPRLIEVEEYGSSEAFLDGHSDRRAGCIIVDICLPGISGLDLLEMIARGRAAYPVIVLSGNASVPSAVRAGRLGVVDFIEKPFRADQLIGTVEAAFGQLHSQRFSGLGALSTLTPREIDVLLCFADGAPNKVVAHSLGLSVRTVEVYRANMMRKLGVRSLAQALFLARDGGYL
jgi:two-component system response regulator FixJ